MSSSLPVIDLGDILDGKQTDQVNPKLEEEIVKQLDGAFSTNGFVYLKNHGVETEQVNKVFQTSRSFFQLPDEVKNRYPLNLETMNGYSFPADRFSNRTKEHYDFNGPDTPVPDEYDPEFRTSVNSLASALVKTTTHLFDWFSMALGLERDYFSSRHRFMYGGIEKSATALTSLYYVPLTDERVEEVNGSRLDEHTDYGTITFVLQDGSGGLQVLANGKWIEAPPIPGTILVLAADVMQMWTADRYKACLHRVVAPEDKAKRQSVRQSIIFFIDPDNGVRVAPLDGSDKYPPFIAPDHVKRRSVEDGYIKVDDKDSPLFTVNIDMIRYLALPGTEEEEEAPTSIHRSMCS